MKLYQLPNLYDARLTTVKGQRYSPAAQDKLLLLKQAYLQQIDIQHRVHDRELATYYQQRAALRRTIHADAVGDILFYLCDSELPRLRYTQLLRWLQLLDRQYTEMAENDYGDSWLYATICGWRNQLSNREAVFRQEVDSIGIDSLMYRQFYA